MMNLGIHVYLRDGVTREADRIRRNYENMSDGVTRLNGIIGNSMYQTWNGVSLMAKGMAAALPLAFAVKEAAAFEKQLAAIQTVWEYGNESLEDQKRMIGEISSEIRNLSMEIGTDPIDTAAGMYTILQANITDTAEAMNILELAQKSAIAGLTSTRDASHVLISLRNAYELDPEEMKTVTDQLFQALAVGVMDFDDFGRSLGKSIGIVRQAGLELPEYFALKATATLSGMTAPQTDSGIRQALQEMFQPKEGRTIEMLEEMKAMGALSDNFEFSTKYMRDEAGSFHAFLEEIYAGAQEIERIGTMVDHNGLAMTADKIMGRLFNDMEGLAFVLNVAGSQGDQYQDVLESIHNSQGKLDDSYGKIADTLNHKWDKLKATLKNFMITVGTPLLKFLGLVVDGLTKALEALTRLFEAVPLLSWAILGVTVVISGLFIAIGLAVAATGVWALAMLGLASILPMAMLKIQSALLTTQLFLRRFFPLMTALAIAGYLLYEAWTNNWGGMRDGLIKFWERTKLVVGGLLELIRSTEDGVGSMSAETADALQRAGLFEFVTTLYMWWYRLKLFWDGFKAGFVDAVNTMKSGIEDMANSANPVLRSIGDAIQWVIDQLAKLRPGEDAQAWEDLGNGVGRYAAHATAIYLVLYLLGRTISIVKMLLVPFMMLWNVVKLVGSSLKFIGGLLAKLSFASLKSTFWNIFNFIGAIVRFIAGTVTVIEKIVGAVWKVARPIITALGWIVRIIGALMGVTAGWALVIIVAVVAAVALIIYYWDEISAFFVRLWDGIARLATDAWDAVSAEWGRAAEFFAPLWETVVSAAESAWQWLQDIWSGFTGWFADLWNGASGHAENAWSGIQTAWSDAVTWFDGVWSPIAEGASELWSGISDFALAAWEFIRGLWVLAVYWFQQLWGALGVAAELYWNLVSTTALAVWELISTAWNAAVTFFTHLWSDIALAAGVFWDWLSGIAILAWDWITFAWRGAVTFFTELWDGIAQVASVFWDWLVSAASTAWDWLVAVWNTAASWFDSTVIQPVTTLFSHLWETASGYATAAWNWLVAVWNTAYGWFDSTVIQPVMTVFNTLWKRVEAYAQIAWDALVAIWTVAATWFDETVIQPVVAVWDYLAEAAGLVAQGAWDAFTGVMGELAGWFETHVIDPIMGLWDDISGIIGEGIDWIGNGIDWVREVGRSGKVGDKQVVDPMAGYKPPKIPEPPRTGGPGGPTGLATGGYIKPGREGLAYLHQDELVINSPTYNALKDFLRSPLSYLSPAQLPVDRDYATPGFPAPDGWPEPEGTDDAPPEPKDYTGQLASHRESRQAQPQADPGTAQLLGQLQQMMRTMQQLAERPVQVTSVINGREVGRSVDAYNRERNARQY